jgi:hypothetical protein
MRRYDKHELGNSEPSIISFVVLKKNLFAYSVPGCFHVLPSDLLTLKFWILIFVGIDK